MQAGKPTPRFGSDLIGLALEEDIGSGDVTTELFAGPDANVVGHIVARIPCIFAGGDIARDVFQRVDPRLEITHRKPDGSELQPGEAALSIHGPASSMLTAERVALNFLQKLSGIATLTRRYVNAVQGTGATILDTRKTTPGFRIMEKAAVVAGGGKNHRMGLHDMVLIKDNHLAASGGIAGLQPGILDAKSRGLKVEVEVDSIDQLREVLTLDGVDIVMLDNMTPDHLREAVALRKPGLLFEASGGVNLETIAAIAKTGVDFISVGALTHSAPSVDLGMDFEAQASSHLLERLV
jgi:nicotinate-nucleotide pyrophosphorylase (carboxylating)